MEYKTKVTIASSLLGVLVLTGALGWFFSQQAVTQRAADEPLFAAFSAPAVSGLSVGDITLTKTTIWGLTVQGKAFPASADRAETYLKTLSTLKRERLVTRDDGKSFGLDTGFKTLKLFGEGGKVLFELQVGSLNDQGTKAYVRFAGQKEIWETDGGFTRTLDLDFNTWADLALFPGHKAEDLIRVAFDSRIETTDKTQYAPFDLVKNTKDGKAKWEDRISNASTETMASWANLVAGFHFSAFVAPKDAPAAGKPLGTLTFAWSNGTATTLTLGAPDAQNRYRANDGQRDFWINDWALGQLLYK